MVLLFAVLTGCTGSPKETADVRGATTSSAGSATTALTDLKRKVSANTGAYSVTFRDELADDGGEPIVTTGRINLNGPYSGRYRMRIPAGDGLPEATVFEYLTTETASWNRATEPKTMASRWGKVKRDGRPAISDTAGYAQLLIGHGPSAYQGEKTLDGVRATHLVGTLTPDEIDSIDPALSKRLRTGKVSSLKCEIWVDADGRAVRLDTEFTLAKTTTASRLTLSGFGAPYVVKAPKT